MIRQKSTGSLSKAGSQCTSLPPLKLSNKRETTEQEAEIKNLIKKNLLFDKANAPNVNTSQRELQKLYSTEI